MTGRTRFSPVILLFGSALAISNAGAQEAEIESAHTFTANIGLFSQYIFRGIAQTNKDPALQAGIDYAHERGFYLGAWGSNVSWISDAAPEVSASLELDFYGGFKKSLGDYSFDIGLIRYQYPADYPTGFVKPHTSEIYAQASWKFVALKYWRSLSDTFGVADSEGSYYLDLSVALPINDRFTLTAHAGRQKYQGTASGASNNIYSYTDYKLEGAYAMRQGWSIGAGRTSTNARRAAYTNLHGTFLGDDMGYAFVKKNF